MHPETNQDNFTVYRISKLYAVMYTLYKLLSLIAGYNLLKAYTIMFVEKAIQ